jgi:isoprenylcysteine carboxyl methyltransferase (ICMT) family protein YpbQ
LIKNEGTFCAKWVFSRWIFQLLHNFLLRVSKKSVFNISHLKSTSQQYVWCCLMAFNLSTCYGQQAMKNSKFSLMTKGQTAWKVYMFVLSTFIMFNIEKCWTLVNCLKSFFQAIWSFSCIRFPNFFVHLCYSIGLLSLVVGPLEMVP